MKWKTKNHFWELWTQPLCTENRALSALVFLTFFKIHLTFKHIPFNLISVNAINIHHFLFVFHFPLNGRLERGFLGIFSKTVWLASIWVNSNDSITTHQNKTNLSSSILLTNWNFLIKIPDFFFLIHYFSLLDDIFPLNICFISKITSTTCSHYPSKEYSRCFVSIGSSFLFSSPDKDNHFLIHRCNHYFLCFLSSKYCSISFMLPLYQLIFLYLPLDKCQRGQIVKKTKKTWKMKMKHSSCLFLLFLG